MHEQQSKTKVIKMMRNAVAVSLAVLCSFSAVADELGSTLSKIKADGVMVVGFRESSIPWAYVDSNSNQVVGYGREITLEIVEAVKQKLDMPNLQVRSIPITAQNRISLMQNGTLDLECNSTSNTEERRRQVAFSTTIAITETQLLTRQDSGITSLKDLDGKSVVVTAGSTSERFMRRYVQDHGLKTNVVSARDHAQSFIMLQTNRAAAFFMDRDVLAALLSKARDADQYVVTGEMPTKETLACMMRKDDPQFKELVDATVTRLHVSGETARLYDKWFLAPIPPDNIVLNTPVSASMKELFAHPSDKTFESQ